MIGTAAWFALAASAVAWEVHCRRSGGRWPDLGRVAAALWAHPVGRWVLLAAWAFVGVHLFARATVPR